MKTKIVYVVTSSLDDIYWEQMWVSIWSLKHYNPAAYVEVVTDEETYDTTRNSSRLSSLELIDYILPQAFDKSWSKKKRSRYLKVRLRQLVDGDFLYIDTDTVVTAELSDIDLLDIQLGMVYDHHDWPRPIPLDSVQFKRVYGMDLPCDAHYYNGGVIYAKDNDTVRDFFEQWYINWHMADTKFEYRDQPPLAKTVIDLNNPVVPLSGIYNCQPLISIRYLHTAKIIHFFNNNWLFPTKVHPLLLKETYITLKEEGGLSEQVIELVLNCKSEFTSLSFPVGVEGAFFLRTYLVRVFYNMYENKRGLFNVLDKITGGMRNSYYYLKYKSFLRYFR